MRPRASSAAGAGLILLAALLSYGPALGAGWVWDDDTFVSDNPLIHAEDGVRRFWLTTEAPDYFPLTSTMLWAEWRLWGGEPAGFHAVNVALHGLAAVLLWRVLLALAVPGALLAGLLFAVHPVNVASVAWITERKAVLPMVLALAALLAQTLAERGGGLRWRVLALVAFLLGLLAKTSIVMLPVVLLGLAWWRRERVGRQDLWRAAPYFVLSLAFGLVTMWFQAHRAIGDDVVREDGPASRLALAARAVWFYLGKALAPVDLSFVYPRWSVDPASPGAWLPLAALAALLAALVRLRRHAAARAALLALGWALAMLLPVLGFVNIYSMRYSLVADHWQYAAIAGPLALAAAGLRRWQARGPRPGLRAAAIAALVVTLGAASRERAKAYAGPETLWADTLAKDPGSWLAHNEQGRLLQERGSVELAIAAFRRAIRHNPGYVEAYVNLATALSGRGRHDEALGAFEEAARFAPGSAPLLRNWANALRRAGRREAALAKYAELLGREPSADLANNVGILHSELGRTAEAIVHFRLALYLDPGFEKARANLRRVEASSPPP